MYTVIPGCVALTFFVSSAYHFGSDWGHGSDALFLGSSMIGIATYMSKDILEQMNIPNSPMFCTIYAIVGVLCIVPSLRATNRKKMSIVMVPLGVCGIYGVMAYGILIHTPRSVWLLVQRYGNNIYLAWAVFTVGVFMCMKGVALVPGIDLMGVTYGILFAHIICTALWRDSKQEKGLPKWRDSIQGKGLPN